MTSLQFESLEGHFYVVLDEFGTLSPIDPNSFDNSSVDNWLSDDSSKTCLLCGATFTMTRRRHHCRYCGLLFCGNCTDNRTMVGDSIARVCDSCAVILIPPNSSSKYSGLKKWCENNQCAQIFDESAKSAGIHFLVSKLNLDSPDSHFNSIRTLYKLLPCHAPALVASEVPIVLLKHSLECKKCKSTALSLDLFVTLYNTDPKSCNVNFAEFKIDLEELFRNESLDMKRSAARLMYTLACHGEMPNVNVVELLKIKDKWVIAFVMAALSKMEKFDAKTEEIVPLILSLFDKGNKEATSVAARYFASFVLSKLTQIDKNASSILAKNDLQNLIDLLLTCNPKDSSDTRPETEVSIKLANVLLNVWKFIAEEKSENAAILISQVLMPLFEVVGIPNEETEDCPLTKVQLIFFEIIQFISTFSELKQMLKSEQMISILTGFSKREDEFGKAASKTLSALNE